jgi:hypothetical protein
MDNTAFDLTNFGFKAGLGLVGLVAVMAIVVYWLRGRLGFGGGGAMTSGCEGVLRATGAACWVQLLSGVTAAMGNGGWTQADWRKIAPHVIPERSACPETLRPRIVQVLEATMAASKDPFSAAYIRQIIEALKR